MQIVVQNLKLHLATTKTCWQRLWTSATLSKHRQIHDSIILLRYVESLDVRVTYLHFIGETVGGIAFLGLLGPGYGKVLVRGKPGIPSSCEVEHAFVRVSR